MGMFPNLLEDETESDKQYNEVSIVIQTLLKVSASAAIAGDIEFGRAFMQSATPLVVFAMSRWPSAKGLAALKNQADTAANVFSATTEEGTQNMPHTMVDEAVEATGVTEPTSEDSAQDPGELDPADVADTTDDSAEDEVTDDSDDTDDSDNSDDNGDDAAVEEDDDYEESQGD